MATGRTGWNRPSDGKVICTSCDGVTREKLGKISVEGSATCRRFEGAGAGVGTGDVPVSGRPDIDPEMGEISPGLPAEGAGMGAGAAGSSTFIATSSVPSLLISGLSSC